MTKDEADIAQLIEERDVRENILDKVLEEELMNCCDEYGNCRQGRDCPVRVAYTPQPLTFKRLLGRFFHWLLTAILGLLWLALVLYCVYVYAN